MFAKCDAVPSEICSTCLNLSNAGKQRVLSRRCRLQDLLDSVQYSDGVQDVDYSILIVISVVLYSDCCKSMKNCRDSAFSYF